MTGFEKELQSFLTDYDTDEGYAPERLEPYVHGWSENYILPAARTEIIKDIHEKELVDDFRATVLVSHPNITAVDAYMLAI